MSKNFKNANKIYSVLKLVSWLDDMCVCVCGIDDVCVWGVDDVCVYVG